MAKGRKKVHVHGMNFMEKIALTQRDLHKQISKDTMLIEYNQVILALNEEFGFGPERVARFTQRLRLRLHNWAKMTEEDSADDKELTYTKAKVEEQLKVILGKYYADPETRKAWLLDPSIPLGGADSSDPE